MFIGRDNELSKIRDALSAPGKGAIMLYGKRRIGKSSLILEAVKNQECKVIYYECLRTSVVNNLRNVEKRIQDTYANKFLHFDNFEDMFEFLGSTGEKVIIILDEYCYLKSVADREYIDSLFQTIVDQMSDNIKLILLGSFVGMMKELLEKENPLFGRFQLIMNIKAFDYLDAAGFYENCSVRKKVEFYSIFGGSPFVCTNLIPEDSLEDNIKKKILDPYGILVSYMENTLLSELSKISNANMILQALANGRKKYSELESILRMKSNGGLDKQLKSLIDMEIITKTMPINKKNDKKKTFYEISDNLVRFYYYYVYGNQDIIQRIGADAFYRNYIHSSVTTFISHRFEDIAKEYYYRRSRRYPELGIRDIGSFWYDIPKEHRNGEFDCVLQYEDGYSVIEVKYYQNPMTVGEIRQELDQIRALSNFMQIRKVGFLCLGGFEKTDENLELIDGNMLYCQ